MSVSPASGIGTHPPIKPVQPVKRDDTPPPKKAEAPPPSDPPEREPPKVKHKHKVDVKA